LKNEVARWFFHVGGDRNRRQIDLCVWPSAIPYMVRLTRYVSRRQLEAMLTTEFVQLQNRHSSRKSAVSITGPTGEQPCAWFGFAAELFLQHKYYGREFGHPRL
jgi:hypothetical protein